MLKLNSHAKKNKINIVENQFESVIGSIHGKINDDETYESIIDIEHDKQKDKKYIYTMNANKTTKLNTYPGYNYLYCNSCDNKINLDPYVHRQVSLYQESFELSHHLRW